MQQTWRLLQLIKYLGRATIFQNWPYLPKEMFPGLVMRGYNPNGHILAKKCRLTFYVWKKLSLYAFYHHPICMWRTHFSSFSWFLCIFHVVITLIYCRHVMQGVSISQKSTINRNQNRTSLTNSVRFSMIN